MSRYVLLLACYRSGQIPEAAWQQHLRDEVFVRWLAHNGHSSVWPILVKIAQSGRRGQPYRFPPIVQTAEHQAEAAVREIVDELHAAGEIEFVA